MTTTPPPTAPEARVPQQQAPPTYAGTTGPRTGPTGCGRCGPNWSPPILIATVGLLVLGTPADPHGPGRHRLGRRAGPGARRHGHRDRTTRARAGAGAGPRRSRCWPARRRVRPGAGQRAAPTGRHGRCRRYGGARWTTPAGGTGAGRGRGRARTANSPSLGRAGNRESAGSAPASADQLYVTSEIAKDAAGRRRRAPRPAARHGPGERGPRGGRRPPPREHFAALERDLLAGRSFFPGAEAGTALSGPGWPSCAGGRSSGRRSSPGSPAPTRRLIIQPCCSSGQDVCHRPPAARRRSLNAEQNPGGAGPHLGRRRLVRGAERGDPPYNRLGLELSERLDRTRRRAGPPRPRGRPWLTGWAVAWPSP